MTTSQFILINNLQIGLCHIGSASPVFPILFSISNIKPYIMENHLFVIRMCSVPSVPSVPVMCSSRAVALWTQTITMNPITICKFNGTHTLNGNCRFDRITTTTMCLYAANKIYKARWNIRIRYISVLCYAIQIVLFAAALPLCERVSNLFLLQMTLPNFVKSYGNYVHKRTQFGTGLWTNNILAMCVCVTLLIDYCTDHDNDHATLFSS